MRSLIFIAGKMCTSEQKCQLKPFTMRQAAFMVPFLHTVVKILGAIQHSICCYSLSQ